MADFLFAAWFLWMTPLDAALSSFLLAAFASSCAFSTSPDAAASRNLRIADFSADLTALLRSCAASFCRLRLIWDLMFATTVRLVWSDAGFGLVCGQPSLARHAKGNDTSGRARPSNRARGLVGREPDAAASPFEEPGGLAPAELSERGQPYVLGDGVAVGEPASERGQVRRDILLAEPAKRGERVHVLVEDRVLDPLQAQQERV